MKSNDVVKINRNVSKLDEMKMLEGKHFTRSDRRYLFDNIRSLKRDTGRSIKHGLKDTEDKIKKSEKSENKLREIINAIDELLSELNGESEILKRQMKTVNAQKLKLLDRRKVLNARFRKVKMNLSDEKEKIALLKSQKKKLKK